MYEYTVCDSKQALPKSITFTEGDERLKQRGGGRKEERNTEKWVLAHSEGAHVTRVHALLQQYVLRLEVAVYDVSAVHDCECVQDLNDEAANEGCAEAAELVLLDQLKEVHAQKLKHQAQVVSEDKVVEQPDHVVRVLGVVLIVKLCRQRK